jgi:hypothetical protein
VALDWQKVDVPLGAGLAEDVHPWLVAPGKLLQATNGWIDRKGAIRARPGTVALASTSEDSYNLLPHNSKLYARTATSLLAWLDHQQGWHRVDHCYEANVVDVLRGERGIYSAGASGDVVSCADIIVTAFPDATPTRLYARVVDAETGQQYSLDSWTGAVQNVRLLARGTTVYMIWADPTIPFQIKCSTLDASNTAAGWSAPAVIAASADMNFDACINPLNGHIVLAYNFNLRIAVRTYLPTIVPDLGPVLFSDSTITRLGITTDGIKVWVGYDLGGGAGGGVWASRLTIALVHEWDTQLHAGATNVTRLGVANHQSKAIVVWQQHPTAPLLCHRWVDAAGVAATGGMTHHVAQLSTPIIYSGQPYVCGHFVSANGLQRYGWLLHLPSATWALDPSPASQARVVSRLSTHTIAEPDLFTLIGKLAPVDGYSAQFLVNVPQQSATRVVSEGFDVVKLEFNARSIGRPSEVQHELAISGGVPASIEGVHCAEMNFHRYPHSATPVAGAGGFLTGGGQYSYCFTYVTIDAAGILHESAPSVPVVVTLGAAETRVDWTVSALTLTEHEDAEDEKRWPVYVVMYRTTNAGTIYYRETAVPNDRRAATVSMVSQISDASIESQERLYTIGGVLPNDVPPAARDMVACGNRLWLISAEDPTQLWMSKINARNHRMPGWSLAFIVRTDQGGAFTALTVLDERLIAFKADSVWIVRGRGPTDAGQGNDIQGAELLSIEHGCIDARSIVATPAGVLFRSREGFMLLTRGLEVQPVSGALRELLDDYPRTAGACLYEEERLALVAVTGTIWIGAGEMGGFTLERTAILAYHYELGEWTWWTCSLTNSPEVRSLVEYDGAPHILGSDGETLAYDPTVYTDANGTWPTLRVSSPWLQASGVQGYQRMRRIGVLAECPANCDISVLLYYDFETTAQDTFTFGALDVAALRVGNRVQFSLHVRRQKCESMRVAIEATTTAGQLPTFTGLALEVGGKQGIFRLPSAARR